MDPSGEYVTLPRTYCLQVVKLSTFIQTQIVPKGLISNVGLFSIFSFDGFYIAYLVVEGVDQKNKIKTKFEISVFIFRSDQKKIVPVKLSLVLNCNFKV